MTGAAPTIDGPRRYPPTVSSSGDADLPVGEAVEGAAATTDRARAPEYAEYAGNGSDVGAASKSA